MVDNPFLPVKCVSCHEVVGFRRPEGNLYDTSIFCPACMQHINSLLSRSLPSSVYDSYDMTALLMECAHQPNQKMADFNDPELPKLREAIEALLDEELSLNKVQQLRLNIGNRKS